MGSIDRTDVSLGALSTTSEPAFLGTFYEPSHALGEYGEVPGSKRLLRGLGETQAEESDSGRDPGSGRQAEYQFSVSRPGKGMGAK